MKHCKGFQFIQVASEALRLCIMRENERISDKTDTIVPRWHQMTKHRLQPPGSNSSYICITLWSWQWMLLPIFGHHTIRQRPMAWGSFCIVPPKVRLGPYPTKPKAEWDTVPVSPRGERYTMTLAMGLCLYFMFFYYQKCVILHINGHKNLNNWWRHRPWYSETLYPMGGMRFLVLKNSDCRIHHEIKHGVEIAPVITMGRYNLQTDCTTL